MQISLSKLFKRQSKKNVFLAKPSPYSKRWWCKNLTILHNKYISLRNYFHQVKRHNPRKKILSAIDTQAWAAKHTYFQALKKWKKEHWEDFLDNTKNI